MPLKRNMTYMIVRSWTTQSARGDTASLLPAWHLAYKEGSTSGPYRLPLPPWFVNNNLCKLIDIPNIHSEWSLKFFFFFVLSQFKNESVCRCASSHLVSFFFLLPRRWQRHSTFPSDGKTPILELPRPTVLPTVEPLPESLIVPTSMTKWLGRRVISEKKIANKVARKQRETAAKTEVEKAKRKAMKTLNTPPGKCSSCVTTVGRVWLFRNLLAPWKNQAGSSRSGETKEGKWHSKTRRTSWGLLHKSSILRLRQPAMNTTRLPGSQAGIKYSLFQLAVEIVRFPSINRNFHE